MRYGYFECFSGVAGDMILGALLDAGCPLSVLEKTVDALQLPGVRLTAERVQRHGIGATQVSVIIEPGSQKKHRHLPQILSIIENANLPPRAAKRAAEVFTKLAKAEAAVHGTTIEKVHFHEVGAADAIVDIVGACVGIDELGLERIGCSPIPTGSGTVTCEHGVMPVPAPATAILLEGVPIAACDEQCELATPTGVAIVTTLADEYGTLPDMTLTGSGFGAGTREGKTRPNLLRLIVGDIETLDAAEHDTVCVLETQLDDATGQTVAFALERLMEAGALDTFIVPIIMKKGRPGQLLTVLTRPADADRIESLMLEQTGSLGVRRQTSRRRILARQHVSVETRFGTIRVKLGRTGDRVQRAWPEYEDCAAAARSAGVSLHEVQTEALHAWTQQQDDA